MDDAAGQAVVTSRRDSRPDAGVVRVALAIMLLAGTGLALQVTLTRIFSLVFQYHFVFLVISLAVLGLGLGAALAYAGRQWGMVAGDLRGIGRATLLLAAVLVLAAWLLSEVDSAELTVSAVVVSLFPFLFIGWINALVYARYAAESNLIYGADLIGAALGVAASLALIALLGPFTTMLLCAAGTSLAAVLMFTAGEVRSFEAGLAFAAVLLLALLAGANHLGGWIGYRPQFITTAPPDKTLVQVLRNPNLDAEVIDTRWGAFAQIDVVATRDEAARFVFTDGGAGSIMLRAGPDDDRSDYLWLEDEIPYLPFTAGPVERTLIIGAGAGYDVFMARYAGASEVTAVEINPAIVSVTRAHGDYNGAILDAEGVETVVTDGRNYVDRSGERFDLIYLNVVYSQAAAPTNAALAENYTFTVEAFRQYWDRLSDGGRLAFTGHNGIEGVRLLMTGLAALQAEGLSVGEALDHTALVMSDPSFDPNTAPSVLIISKAPWSEAAAAAYAAEVGRRGLVPLFIPFEFEEPMQVLRSGSLSFDEYLQANTDFNIFPTSDDRPFFYHLSGGLPRPVRTLLRLSLLLALGYFIAAAALMPERRSQMWPRLNLLLFFTLLGAGYILVEVAMLKRFELLLGNPVLSLIATLGALLLGSGAGSLFGRRFAAERLPRIVTTSTLAAAAWLVVALVVYPALLEAALPLALGTRFVITVLALLPLGFLMGMPFPGGLRVAAAADGPGVPLYWGVNAIASTLGGVLATVIGLLLGFPFALLAGAVGYLAAALLVGFSWRRNLQRRPGKVAAWGPERDSSPPGEPWDEPPPSFASSASSCSTTTCCGSSRACRSSPCSPPPPPST